jgi:hypothetical protein
MKTITEKITYERKGKLWRKLRKEEANGTH